MNIIKGQKGQHLNEREARLIYEGAVEGLLLFDVKNKNGSIRLTYNTDGLLNLCDFLQMNTLSKRFFVILLRNIVVTLKSVENNKLSRDLIVWDLETTYIDPTSWHIYLMYIPLQPYETEGNLKNFLQQFISLCNFASTGNVAFVQEFVEELSADVAYTAGKLEAYCDKISEQLVVSNGKKTPNRYCPKCMAKLMPQETSCPYCGMKTGEPAKSSSVSEIRRYPSEASKSGKEDMSVHEDESGVITIFKGPGDISQEVWIEDLARNEKIVIGRFPFRLGKMEGITDHRIFNNNVSRKHADIIKEQGRYYVVDLGSTNGTYLCGRKIQTGVKEAVNDGTVFQLADAKFMFHIG